MELLSPKRAAVIHASLIPALSNSLFTICTKQIIKSCIIVIYSALILEKQNAMSGELTRVDRGLGLTELQGGPGFLTGGLLGGGGSG